MIHKGKVIYPDTGKNNSKNNDLAYDDVSEQLLDISAADIIHRRKKPSIVVLGLREQTATTRSKKLVSEAIFSVVRQLTPCYVWNKLSCGLRRIFSNVSSLLWGIQLFFRSILYPPQTAP